MSNLRRYYCDGYTYFITSTTYRRRRILINNFDLFHDVCKRAKDKFCFETIAWIVLPDHFHFIIRPDKEDPSNVMKYIKQSFAMRYLNKQGLISGAVWQLRFWDHVIRNDKDLEHHVDYVHYNAVKHGLIEHAIDYKYSSINLYKGRYEYDWILKSRNEKSYYFGE